MGNFPLALRDRSFRLETLSWRPLCALFRMSFTRYAQEFGGQFEGIGGVGFR